MNKLVLNVIRQQIGLFINKNNVLSGVRQTEVDFEEVSAFEKEIASLHKEQDKYLSLRTGLYEDMKNNIITQDDFKSFNKIYEQRYNELGKSIENQEKTIKKLFKSCIISGLKLEQIKETMQITGLDRIVLITFINRIIVHEDKRVYIEFRCKESFCK